jgi:hypothetical protein
MLERLRAGEEDAFRAKAVDVGHQLTVLVTATDQAAQVGLATATPVGPITT